VAYELRPNNRWRFHIESNGAGTGDGIPRCLHVLQPRCLCPQKAVSVRAIREVLKDEPAGVPDCVAADTPS
jgi:hypothetical protein